MQKIILSICVSIIIISIFHILIPNKNMESSMKFALNIFLISIIAIPIIKSIKKIDIPNYSELLDKNKFYEENLKDKVENSNKNILENALKAVFYKKGYNNVDISIDIDKDNKTTNIEIKIPLSENYDAEEIKEITKQQTGINPNIKYY